MGECCPHFYEAITQPLEAEGKEQRLRDVVVIPFPVPHSRDTAHSVPSRSHPRDSHSGEMGWLPLDISQLESSSGSSRKDVASKILPILFTFFF